MQTERPGVHLPTGTHVIARVEVRDEAGSVVCPAGGVGIIVLGPERADEPYVVRFPSGSEGRLLRHELIIRKSHQRDILLGVERQPGFAELEPHIILRCVVGSRAYGLDEDDSDTDWRGIYLPPAELHWSITGIPAQIEHDDTQEAYWELHKFLVMALKANSNILECLYSPLVEHAAPLAEELLAIREAFLSQFVFQTYNGYVISQFRKLEGDLRTRGTIKWKHAMHLIRLLLAGITILREGRVPVRVEGEYRERLLAIRRAEIPWDEVDGWRLDLHREFDAAFATTHLPEIPDYERADAFLIAARRSMVT